MNEKAAKDMLKLSTQRGVALSSQLGALVEIDQRAGSDSAALLSSILQFNGGYVRGVRQGWENLILSSDFSSYALETQETIFEHVGLWAHLAGAIGILTFSRRLPNFNALSVKFPSSAYIPPSERGVSLSGALENLLLGIEQFGLSFSGFWSLDLTILSSLGKIAIVDLALEETYDFNVEEEWKAILLQAVPITPNVERILTQLSGIMPYLGRGKTRVIPVAIESGDTIEGLALRVLGNANRWLELTEFNNLQFPYVVQGDASSFLPPEAGDGVLSAPTVIGGKTGTLLDAVLLYPGMRLFLSHNGTKQMVTLETINLNNGAFTIKETWGFAFPTISDVKIFAPSEKNERKVLGVGDILLVPSGEDGTLAVSHDQHQDTQGERRLYGTDLSCSGGMLTVSNGDLLTVEGVKNLSQGIANKFKVVRGSVPYMPGLGTGLLSYLGWKAKPYFGFLAQVDVRQTLQNDPRIASISDLNGKIKGDVLELTLSVVTTASEQFPPMNLKIPLT